MTEELILGRPNRHKLDLRGAIIPFTLLKVSQAFRMIPAGDVLEVYWSDPDTPGDMFKILPPKAYDLISMEVLEANTASYRLALIKKPSAPDSKD